MKRDPTGFEESEVSDEYGAFLKRWKSAESAYSWAESVSTNPGSEGLVHTDKDGVLFELGPDVLEAACDAPLPMSPFWDEELGFVPYTPIDSFVSSEARWAAVYSPAAEEVEYTPCSPSIYSGLTYEERWAAACSPPAEDLEYTPCSPSVYSRKAHEEIDPVSRRLTAEHLKYAPPSPSVYSHEIHEESWTALGSPTAEKQEYTPCSPIKWGSESLEDPWTLHAREMKTMEAAWGNVGSDAEAEPWNPPSPRWHPLNNQWPHDLKASLSHGTDSKSRSAESSESEDDSANTYDSIARTTTVTTSSGIPYTYSPPIEEPHTNSESGREWRIKNKPKPKRKRSALIAQAPSTPSTYDISTRPAKKQRVKSRLLSTAATFKTGWRKAQHKSADLTRVSEITKKWLKDIICDPDRETRKPSDVDSEEELAPVHQKLFADFCGEDFSRPWASKPRTVHIGPGGEELVEEAPAPPKGLTWEGLREEQDLKAERFQERLDAKGAKAVKGSLSWGLLGVSEYRRLESGSDVWWIQTMSTSLL